MNEQAFIKTTNLQVIGYFIAVLLVLSTIAAQFFSLREGINLIGKPFPGFFVSWSGRIGSYALPHWTGVKASLGFPVATEINGKKFVNNTEEFLKEVKSKPIGTEFKYKFYTGNKELSEYTIPTMRFEASDFIHIRGVNFIVELGFLLCGTLLFFLRPNERASWSVLLLSLNMPFFLAHAAFLDNISVITEYFTSICSHTCIANSYYLRNSAPQPI